MEFFRFSILMTMIAAGSLAKASILFEPYGGYSVGSGSNKYSTAVGNGVNIGKTTGASGNGFGYGGRVGFLAQHFLILAGEYQVINGQEQFDGATSKIDFKQNTIFVTAGFQSPRGFRLMGSYGFDAQADEGSGASPAHLKGTALKFAIGWHLPMPVALNLEYTIYKYTQSTTNGATSTIADTYEKYDRSTVMATISFPFELGRGSSGGGSPSN